MRELTDATAEIANQLRAGLGKTIPDAAEKQWLAELAADLAAEKIRFASATNEDEREKVADNLDVLAATWKLRLAQKELLSQQIAEKIITTAITTAVSCCFPQATATGALAKFVIAQVITKVNTPSAKS